MSEKITIIHSKKNPYVKKLETENTDLKQQLSDAVEVIEFCNPALNATSNCDCRDCQIAKDKAKQFLQSLKEKEIK